jgi:OmpA family protein
MMKATPIAPFVITKPDFLLEFQIVTLDAPAHLDGGHQFFKRDVRRQGGQEIASRLGFPFGLFDQQPFFLAGAISVRSPYAYLWARPRACNALCLRPTPLADTADSPEVTATVTGGAIGAGGSRTGYDQTLATIASNGATQATVTADAKETMWKAYLGYNFLRQFSIEGGYWNFGNPSYSATITSNVPETTMRLSFSAEDYGADAVLWLRIRNAFSGVGKIGAMRTNTHASVADPGDSLSPLPGESVGKFNSHWGLGAKYDIRRDLAARVEIETVCNIGDAGTFGSADVIMWSLGMDYKV